MSFDIPYTDLYQAENSSVIENIWYDADAQEMYVELKRGSIYGYENVPWDVFKAFTSQETLGGSLGQYWNEWIKPYLAGFGEVDPDTAFVSRTDEEEEEYPTGPIQRAIDELTTEMNEREVVRTPITASYLEGNGPVVLGEPAPAEARNEYLINFSHQNGADEHDSNIVLFAPSIEDALDRFRKIQETAGYWNVVINSATLYFN